MATIIRAQVLLPNDNNLPEDVVQNTLHFGSLDATPADDAALIHGNLTTFYQAIDTYLSSNLASTATVKYYDLADPEPRSPIHQANIALTLSGSSSLPQEIACCLSFRGDLESGTVPARRRGRIYIGPLGQNAGNNAEPHRPAATFRTSLANAAAALLDDAFGDGVPWVVYSPTTDSAEAVVAGWVDDAWDVQRRRGVAATERTLWS